MEWMGVVGDWAYWAAGLALLVLALIRIGMQEAANTEAYRLGSFALLGVAALFFIAARVGAS